MTRGLELNAWAESLHPVLKCWLTNFERACQAFPQTCRAWFVEPTLVALLSSASWQVGLPSIIEARAERPGAHDPKLDLLIGGPEGGLGFEAKIHYVPHEIYASRINQRLRKALKDASSVTHPLVSRYFGLVFALIQQDDPKTNLGTVLNATIEHVRQNYPCLDALAWTLLDQPEAVYRDCVLAVQEVRRPQGAT